MNKRPLSHFLFLAIGGRFMKFSKKFLFVSASIAFALLSFNACSDDSDSSNSVGTAGSENENLGPCGTETDGDIQYIAAEDAYYLCEDGKWELTIIEQSSSSKTEKIPSSSSKKQDVIPGNDPKSSSSKTEVKPSSSSTKIPDPVSSSSEESESPEDPSSSSEESVSPEDPFSSASETCDEGDKYYNKSEHKAYQCIDGEMKPIDWDLPETDNSSSSEASEPSFDYGEMSDAAGTKYKTITIGEQTWMAENLNYATAESYCYGDKDDNCTKYGRLYTWEAAKTACPTGWHLPTKEEWEALITEVGTKAGQQLKSTSEWQDNGNGTNAYGFTVKPAGNRTTTGNYVREYAYAYFWSVTAAGENDAYRLEFDGSTDVALFYITKNLGYSVRCLMGAAEEEIISSSSEDQISSSSSPFNYGTMYDDNHDRTYKTITIGSQIWMAENLNYQGYEVKGACYDDIEENCEKYGRLYTWKEATKACPTGWHLPSYDDFQYLLVYVHKASAGKHLKSTTGWEPYQVSETEFADGNGDDLYGFSLLPTGIYYIYDKKYLGEGRLTSLWTNAGNDETGQEIIFGNKSDEFDLLNVLHGEMVSVRCVNDETVEITPSSKEFEYGTLKDDRDGKEYKTIKIDDQNWMAENLNYVYKFNDVKYNFFGGAGEYYGASIKIDSTSWCYNNDPENCKKYGRMYLWSAAMDSAGKVDSKNAVPSKDNHIYFNETTGCGLNAKCKPNTPHRGVCPEGWHVPSLEEFQKLIDFVNSKGNTGSLLKSTTDWSFYGNGNDEFGFSVRPGGYFEPGLIMRICGDEGELCDDDYQSKWKNAFVEQGSKTNLWTSTQYEGKYGADDTQNIRSWAINFSYAQTEASLIGNGRTEGHYLRCVQD